MFDPLFWKISPKEASLMDPQLRKFVEHCWQALEQGGIITQRETESIGVFAGCSSGQYYTQHIANNEEYADRSRWELRQLNDKDFLATRMSYMLGLNGPAININTACSTSLVSIVEACKNLSLKSCNYALAGGVSFALPTQHGYVYKEGMISSKDGHCRPFDEKASGTVSGSGVGVVLLKRLSDAIEDKDHIHSVIKGYSSNNDGNRKVSFSAPSVIGQTECILNSQIQAGITSETIDYVECHGTGTALGDPIEIAALSDAFTENSVGQRQSACILGAVKANIGHANTAAGVAGFIKTSMMLEEKIIPA